MLKTSSDEFNLKLDSVLRANERMTAFIDRGAGKHVEYLEDKSVVCVQIDFYKKATKKPSTHLVFFVHRWGVGIVNASFED